LGKSSTFFEIFLFFAANKEAGDMKKADLYTLDDFYLIKKIDAHIHYYTSNETYLQYAQKCNTHLISINVDFLENEWISPETQLNIALEKKENAPAAFSYIGAVPVQHQLDDQAILQAINQVELEKNSGAIAVKIWKNVGMKITFQGELVTIDHPLFKPLLTKLADIRLPLLGHFGEPRNCWLPLDEMTVESDKLYFSKHPEFHMYLHPEFPSYKQQIEACNTMLHDNPSLQFVGAHLGSSEYSIEEISKRLDAYPNMYMDLAERVCHLQHQAAENHQAVYNFMMRYQDRLLYGSDMVFNDNKTEQAQLEELEKRWLNQWAFFTQNNSQSTWEVTKSFKGLGLPKTVVDKIYYHNAFKAYPLLKNSF
jgi:predicted TIM-barrel fold metal-dependent hydrolase